jgi:transposase
VPLWGLRFFLVYAMRRVNCPDCGVIVEQVPWGQGKRQTTTAYAWFLARWASRLNWTETARAFQTSWETVFRAVEQAVEWGLAHRDLSRITAIGMDEIFWRKGHRYLTVVYQIDGICKRLLWVGEDRTTQTVLRFFRWFGKERSSRLQFVCSDMWQNYLAVIAKKAANAVHILDRFHLVARLHKAIDEIRGMSRFPVKLT